MTEKKTLDQGSVATYSTRPVGLNTKLFLEAGDHDTEVVWHIELCCKDDNKVELDAKDQKSIDVSSAAGALITVRNTGWSTCYCWTDY